ncbi:DUF2167 domain-containing protein [Paenibacillus sp. RRE4]|uniref:DUF2167 domain-containing protein n=1 Tax=Paenibacillus sp. RRE4 TaxID=2962587 RepID=UPI002881B104|nr:DUF2167 domain-containing protein [Paenibacillus sp. RRE4]MDT0125833.1 DUF2167 domain-containing protein [Paenibacillus sp. RRE4]
MKKKCFTIGFTLFLLATLLISTLKADAESYSSADRFEWQKGPATISLNGIASINIPKSFSFFDEENTKRFMAENPPAPNGSEIGSIYSMNMDSPWNVIFEIHNIGYIDDRDKNDLDADELLESHKRSPEGQQEKASTENDSYVLRWDVEPTYEDSKHQLRYSLGWRDPLLQNGIVNYKVNFLTREGYISVILVTPSHYFEESRQQFEEMVLQHVKINKGHTYEEFDASVDKKSKLSLINLIPGGDGAATTKKTERLTLLLKGLIFIVAASAVVFAFFTIRRRQKHQTFIASSLKTESTESNILTHKNETD